MSFIIVFVPRAFEAGVFAELPDSEADVWGMGKRASKGHVAATSVNSTCSFIHVMKTASIPFVQTSSKSTVDSPV